ncbi:unnamed protein product [Pseudo-nitzschia multistriata]|uniref:Uncharacterized protein n=1 Tax=Pseudo-nitzschia multistriata TaxID=183589 RepID=A0A448ZT20_9STRA|nr:unnamed protein product [Pseudo-nitzschia multistriata]
MRQQTLSMADSTSSVSSVYERPVRVPAVMFFIVFIIFHITLQLKTAFQIDIARSLTTNDLASDQISDALADQQERQEKKKKDSDHSATSLIHNVESIKQALGGGESGETVTLFNNDNNLFPEKVVGVQEHRDSDDHHDISSPSEDSDHTNNLLVTTRMQKYELDLDDFFDTEGEGNQAISEAKKTQKKKKKKRKTRAFFGIMTYDSESERKRRNLIRKTFLSYFTNHTNRTLVSEDEYNEKKHWICSLNDLDYGRLEHPEKCRMAYAFVQGANPNGTTMLLNFNESYPLSLPPPKFETKKEQKDASDSVYLNIQENGRFGKSPTWFRYAIDVLERHGWMKDFDYIFKSDGDNLIYTPNFFRFMDKLPQKRAVRVYGGRPLNYNKCGGDSHDHCSQMVGPHFMAGGCYFLSLDLAKFISDETTFDHMAVKLPHEDMTTGNFVYSHPKKIRVVKEPRKKGVIRTHPVKKDRAFKHRWNKMLKEEQVRLVAAQVNDE